MQLTPQETISRW